MDLSTTYMGLKLKNPIVPSASPLSRDLDSLKKLEDAGASAVVMYSLFEEQIHWEALELYYHTTHGSESSTEAKSYFPEMYHYNHGPEDYLRQLVRAKESLSIPVIASLNGSSTNGWVQYARRIEETGVDGLELNMYNVAADFSESGDLVEKRYLEVVRTVKNLKLPVAVKLSPFFSSLGHFAKQLDEAGTNALVLFNRFYQPDINLDTLEVTPNVVLSHSSEMRLPLRWIAILYGRIQASLAATTGIHTGEDAIKMLMAGADVAMVCSALLKFGPARITEMLDDMRRWMEVHEYESVSQMKGSMSQKSYDNPSAFERANYTRALTSFTLTDDLLYHN